MKKHCFLFSLFLFLFINGKLLAESHQVHIAFLGNSITIGASLPNPAAEAYPYQLASMLEQVYGDTCVVGNFAVSGRTMLKKGDFPLWNEPAFQKGWNFAPDIVFILMGTNDSKPYNWDDYGHEFKQDYQAMIDTFKLRNPRCLFMLGYPPPAFWVNFDIRDSVIKNGVIPVIDEIIRENEAILVDFYTPFADSVHLFPDGIHPNARGAKVMAQLVFDKLMETHLIEKVDPGYTFVTDVSTSKRLIAQNTPVNISWTTRNATTVTFDGVSVGLNGTLEMSPSETSTYTIRAEGSKGSDVMKLTQEVYIPVLTEMKANPRSGKMFVGDSIAVKVTFFDQEGKEITNQSFDLEWEIYEGEGVLVDATGSTVIFVATGAGTTRIRGILGSLSVEIRFVVDARTTAGGLSVVHNFHVFPNPARNSVTVYGVENQQLQYRISNAKGKLMIAGLTLNGTIGLEAIPNGLYYLEGQTVNEIFRQKLLIKR